MNDQERGKRAEQLMNQELLQESFAVCKAKYLDMFEMSMPDDAKQRERAYALIRALDDVKTHLEHVAAQGELSKSQEKDLKLRGKFSII